MIIVTVLLLIMSYVRTVRVIARFEKIFRRRPIFCFFKRRAQHFQILVRGGFGWDTTHTRRSHTQNEPSIRQSIKLDSHSTNKQYTFSFRVYSYAIIVNTAFHHELAFDCDPSSFRNCSPSPSSREHKI